MTYLLSYTVSKLWPIIGQISASDIGVLHFNTLAGGDPLHIQINFTSSETRMIFLPDAENHTIVCLFVRTKHRNVMDRWTDGQTDRYLSAVLAIGIASTRCKWRRLQ